MRGVAVAAFIVVAIVALANWTEVGMTYGPRCDVGVQGTAASVEVQSWSAQAICDQLETSTPGAYRFNGQVTTPVVCQFDIRGARFTVHDDGTFKLIGNATCVALRSARDQSSLAIPASTSTATATPTLAPVRTSVPTAALATLAPALPTNACALRVETYASGASLCTLYATLEAGQPANRITLDVTTAGDTQTETLSVFQTLAGREQRLWFATASAQRAAGSGDYFGEVFTYTPQRSVQSHVVYVALRCSSINSCGPYTTYVDAVVDGVFGQVMKIDTDSARGASVDGTELIVNMPGSAGRWDVSWTGSSYFVSRVR